MKLFTGLLLCSLVLGVSSQWYSFFTQAYEDLGRVTTDLLDAVNKHADKILLGQLVYNIARRGRRSTQAATVISDAREDAQRVTDLFKPGSSGHGREDSRADQAADEWGRSGKDPNHYRPAGLPSKY
ncbi:serum amyloid A-2 protein-like isoform X3 [Hippopotamus amphibius kiboko]|nr:serum amyloid A-2 protein-like isoform X3 [Hippopotamus amphibius kiboko]